MPQLRPEPPSRSMMTSAASSETAARILVIDDDRKLCRLISDYLGPFGYVVEAAHTGPMGAERALAEEWHAIILDLMLPGCDGCEVLRRIRREKDTPVLMLTARGDEADRIVGLELGADDYLPKTFSTRELLARLRAVMRRGKRAVAAEGPEMLACADIRVCPDTRTAFQGEEQLVLTPVELDFLISLVRAKGRVKTREQLLDEVRSREYEVFDRSVDVHISGLRKKLGDDSKNPRYIRTLRSAGYLFIDPEA